MLSDNRADYMRTNGRGIPRDGAALLHGVTWCGECGHKMMVRYKGGSQYVCSYLHQQHDAPVCQCLRAGPIDAEVGKAFLAAVAPAEIEAWARAHKTQRQADEALRRAEAHQIERLRYEVRLAERQFNRVDPDNRLVASELERRWGATLLELRRAEEALAKRTALEESGLRVVDPRLRAKIVTLGRSLPQIWADPATRREHRKALLRCLIDKVVLRRATRDQAFVRIVWRGGATTELTVKMPVNSLNALPRHAEMEARVIELAQAGFHDDEIARTLSDEGHRSPRRSAEVSPGTVRGLRLRHGLKVVPRQTRWPRVVDYLTVTDVATRLQVSANWLRGKIRRDALVPIRETSGRYLFPDSAATFEALRELRAGRIRRVDLTQRRHQDEGYHHG